MGTQTYPNRCPQKYLNGKKMIQIGAQNHEQNELSAEGVLFKKAIIAELFTTNLGSAWRVHPKPMPKHRSKNRCQQYARIVCRIIEILQNGMPETMQQAIS